jgi:sugar/nucleoside kinase (ribokinase family)
MNGGHSDRHRSACADATPDCVALTDASAERSFISYIGAEGEVTAEDLNSVSAEAATTSTSAATACCMRQGAGAAGLDAGAAERDQRGVRSGAVVESPDSPLMQALLPRIDVWTSNASRR